MLLDFKRKKSMTHKLSIALLQRYFVIIMRFKVKGHLSWHGLEINGIRGILVIDCVCTKKTGTAGWELEGLHSEGEVLIIRIVHEETVVDGLLQAFGFIALWYKWAGITRSQTFLNTGGLGESLVVSFNVVDNDSPFAFSVDSTKRLDVGSFRGAEIGLFLQSVRSFH